MSKIYCKCKKPVRDAEYSDMCGLCGDIISINLEKKKVFDKLYGKEKHRITNITKPKKKRK